jgi:predicted nucleotidyltransferase
VRKNDEMLSLAELKARLRRFCEKHRIQRLDVFSSAARGEAGPSSDVDLLVTLDESSPVSVAELLEMAGEAEEVVGRPALARGDGALDGCNGVSEFRWKTNQTGERGRVDSQALRVGKVFGCGR